MNDLFKFDFLFGKTTAQAALLAVLEFYCIARYSSSGRVCPVVTDLKVCAFTVCYNAFIML